MDLPKRIIAAAAFAAAAVAAPAGGQEAPKGVVHKLPASERSYELLVPPGSAAEMKDLPLVVYLHAAKDPQLDRAKRDYWPVLAKRKCLMVIPRGKGEKMWLAGEEKYVTDVIADVQTRYSVDAKRICLLGVSGGGQVALFLADHLPEKFRAVIVVSASPVTIRGSRHEWFYPNRKVLKTCPFLAINHITQGSSLMYWRQVRAKLNPAGASISVLPVTGKAEHYQPPPAALGKWLDEALAGKHPAPLSDPQKAAVAKMLAPVIAALPAALAEAKAAPSPAGKIVKTGKVFELSLSPPADFERSKTESRRDATGAPLTQIRLEHAKWPIRIRADARATAGGLGKVLAAEEAETIARGLLYQVYHTGRLTVAARRWRHQVGSITYPDRRRGWVSALFVHAAAPMAGDPRQWLSVTVTDETQQPDAKQLAAIVKTALASVAAKPAPTTTAPGGD